MQPGTHLNYLQFATNSNSLSVDVDYNTSYQTRQASAGEGYQFYSFATALVQNVTYAYNVMIAAAPGTGLPVPTPLLSISVFVRGGGSQNAGVAHDNYIDRTAGPLVSYADDRLFRRDRQQTGIVLRSSDWLLLTGKRSRSFMAIEEAQPPAPRS